MIFIEETMIEAVDIGLIACINCLNSSPSCSCLRSDDLRCTEIKKLLLGLRTSGFVQILNHNVSESIVNSAIDSSKFFFSKNLEEKTLHESKDKARRGFSPLNAENFASLAGASNKPNDSVEKYRIGPSIIDEDKSEYNDYYNSKEAKLHFFPNNWNNLPTDFVTNLQSYYDSMTQLAYLLLKIIQYAIKLETTFFENLVDKHTSILTLNYYPSLPTETSKESNTRVAEHTDVSMLTIVSQQLVSSINNVSPSMGGLEVLDTATGQWIAVPYTPNSFIVNVGDCLSDWSRGLFKSSMHRVVMNPNIDSDCERYSMAYFFTPNYNAELVWPLGSESVDATISKAATYTNWRKDRIKRAIQMMNKK